jgi:hypothetical protein
VIDVPHFCAESGHVLLAAEPVVDAQGEAVAYLIRRA